MLTACVAAVLLATSLFAGAGCGKSSNSTGTTVGASTGTSPTTATEVANSGPASSKALTRDALVAEANAICKRIAAESAANSKIKSQEVLNRKMVLLAVYDNGQLTTLSRLRPPGAMESEWKQIAALSKSLAAEMMKFGNYLRENRVKFAYSQVLPLVTEVGQKFIAVAHRIGLRDCVAI